MQNNYETYSKVDACLKQHVMGRKAYDRSSSISSAVRLQLYIEVAIM
jgi:hypothetical protein